MSISKGVNEPANDLYSSYLRLIILPGRSHADDFISWPRLGRRKQEFILFPATNRSVNDISLHRCQHALGNTFDLTHTQWATYSNRIIRPRIPYVPYLPAITIKFCSRNSDIPYQPYGKSMTRQPMDWICGTLLHRSFPAWMFYFSSHSPEVAPCQTFATTLLHGAESGLILTGEKCFVTLPLEDPAYLSPRTPTHSRRPPSSV